jgi:hypothetical protein
LSATNRFDLGRDQLAQPPRCQIAGDPGDAQRIGPVRGDGNIDHRVVQPRIVDIAHAHR